MSKIKQCQYFRTNLGNRLKKYRYYSGLSQRELAEIIGVTNVTLSNWEGGKTTPPLEQALHLAHTLDVSYEELFGS